MNETQKSYSEAVKEAKSFVNTPEAYQITKKEVSQTPKPTNATTEKRIDKANKIWQKSTSITGTLAERYLTHYRSINRFNEAEIRFNRGVYSSESKQFEPALVAAFRDKEHKITAVECIYLDKDTANKANLNVAKRSHGVKKGSAIEIGKNTDKAHNITYLAEGLVTALSIKEALPYAHVLAVGGKSNIKNIDLSTLNDQVIVCADYDLISLNEDKNMVEVLKYLKENGKIVDVVYPSMDGKKVDYNDILMFQGVKETTKQLQSHLIKSPLNESKEIQPNHHIKQKSVKGVGIDLF